ncbi:MAG: acyl-CoA thioesterase [Planctomycetota bacterium]
MPRPEQFPIVVEFSVQWGDQDMFGHVNNIHFLRWFESARIEYLSRCGARISNAGVGPILAAVNCDYRRQIRYPDQVFVSASVEKIGTSSLTIQHYLWCGSQHDLAAEGKSVVVMFDYQSQQSVSISQEIRDAIAALDAQIKPPN